MPRNHPYHCDESFVQGQVQSFVDAAHPVTEEERARPRYGRPVRHPDADSPAPPTSGTPSESAT